MTGKISAWRPDRGCGQITSHTGDRLRFDRACIWPYDAARLALGQVVSFEVEEAEPQRAVNVHQPQQSVLPGRESAASLEHPFRYLGFDNAAGRREYRFEHRSLGHETEQLVVSADPTLLHQHGVSLQEGPGLCGRFLSAEWGAPTRSSPYLLDEHDIQRHRTPTPDPAAKRPRQPFRPRPVAASV